MYWTCGHCGCQGIVPDIPFCPMCYRERAMPTNTTGGYSNQHDADLVASQQDAEAADPPADDAPEPTADEAGPDPVHVQDNVQESPEDAPAEADDKPDYSAYAVRDLIDLCKERGITYSGPSGTLPKGTLVARLSENDQAADGS